MGFLESLWQFLQTLLSKIAGIFVKQFTEQKLNDFVEKSKAIMGQAISHAAQQHENSKETSMDTYQFHEESIAVSIFLIIFLAMAFCLCLACLFPCYKLCKKIGNSSKHTSRLASVLVDTKPRLRPPIQTAMQTLRQPSTSGTPSTIVENGIGPSTTSSAPSSFSGFSSCPSSSGSSNPPGI